MSSEEGEAWSEEMKGCCCCFSFEGVDRVCDVAAGVAAAAADDDGGDELKMEAEAEAYDENIAPDDKTTKMSHFVFWCVGRREGLEGERERGSVGRMPHTML